MESSLSEHGNTFNKKQHYFVHVIFAHLSQNAIFRKSDLRAGTLLNIKEKTVNETSTLFQK